MEPIWGSPGFTPPSFLLLEGGGAKLPVSEGGYSAAPESHLLRGLAGERPIKIGSRAFWSQTSPRFRSPEADCSRVAQRLLGKRLEMLPTNPFRTSPCSLGKRVELRQPRRSLWSCVTTYVNSPSENQPSAPPTSQHSRQASLKCAHTALSRSRPSSLSFTFEPEQAVLRLSLLTPSEHPSALLTQSSGTLLNPLRPRAPRLADSEPLRLRPSPRVLQLSFSRIHLWGGVGRGQFHPGSSAPPKNAKFNKINKRPSA